MTLSAISCRTCPEPVQQEVKTIYKSGKPQILIDLDEFQTPNQR